MRFDTMRPEYRDHRESATAWVGAPMPAAPNKGVSHALRQAFAAPKGDEADWDRLVDRIR
jgi:hypothetical protein